MSGNIISEEAASALTCEKYRNYLTHLELSPERELELVQILQCFLSGFVDRAFGHDPIQLAAGDRLQLCDEGPIRPVVASGRDLTPQHDDLSGAFTDVSGPGQGKR